MMSATSETNEWLREILNELKDLREEVASLKGILPKNLGDLHDAMGEIRDAVSENTAALTDLGDQITGGYSPADPGKNLSDVHEVLRSSVKELD